MLRLNRPSFAPQAGQGQRCSFSPPAGKGNAVPSPRLRARVMRFLLPAGGAALLCLLPACGEKVPEGRMRGALGPGTHPHPGTHPSPWFAARTCPSPRKRGEGNASFRKRGEGNASFRKRGEGNASFRKRGEGVALGSPPGVARRPEGPPRAFRPAIIRLQHAVGEAGASPLPKAQTPVIAQAPRPPRAHTLERPARPRAGTGAEGARSVRRGPPSPPGALPNSQAKGQRGAGFPRSRPAAAAAPETPPT